MQVHAAGQGGSVRGEAVSALGVYHGEQSRKGHGENYRGELQGSQGGLS